LFITGGDIPSGTANSVSSSIVFTSELILRSSSDIGGSGFGNDRASSHLLNKKAHSSEHKEC
jgi:hypothetical protein